MVLVLGYLTKNIASIARAIGNVNANITKASTKFSILDFMIALASWFLLLSAGLPAKPQDLGYPRPALDSLVARALGL
jgi:hypothetical protein